MVLVASTYAHRVGFQPEDTIRRRLQNELTQIHQQLLKSKLADDITLQIDRWRGKLFEDFRLNWQPHTLSTHIANLQNLLRDAPSPHPNVDFMRRWLQSHNAGVPEVLHQNRSSFHALDDERVSDDEISHIYAERVLDPYLLQKSVIRITAFPLHVCQIILDYVQEQGQDVEEDSVDEFETELNALSLDLSSRLERVGKMQAEYEEECDKELLAVREDFEQNANQLVQQSNVQLNRQLQELSAINQANAQQITVIQNTAQNQIKQQEDIQKGIDEIQKERKKKKKKKKIRMIAITIGCVAATYLSGGKVVFLPTPNGVQVSF